MISNRRIRHKLSTLPDTPGIYLMKDDKDRVIYVGKASSLQRRVKSYFQSQTGMSGKNRVLVRQIDDFEVIQTNNEAEAYILEDSLIKRYQPRFNIRLRDDKRYPYIKITDESFPRIQVVRRRLHDKGHYYGPFTNVGGMRATLKLARKLLPIRTCNQQLPAAEPLRPCLNYHIDRCLGPCTGEVSKKQYMQAINDAKMLFSGRTTSLLKTLRERMGQVAHKKRFEQAATIRDQIQALSNTLKNQSVALSDLVDRDVAGVAIEEKHACIKLFLVREGRVRDRETYFMQAPHIPAVSDVLSAFVTQYYAQASSIPAEVLLPEQIEGIEAVSDWLSTLRERKVEICVPKRGNKYSLVELAMNNARYALRAEQSRKVLRADMSSALAKLVESLNLSNYPQRIEAFDISNIQGQEPAGSMVVFEGGKPLRKDYRRFRVRTLDHPDDYAMMNEVLYRRFRRGLTQINDPSISKGKFTCFPDLLIVDGGKGQLNIATSVLRRLHIEGISVIGIAKQNEQVFQPGNSRPVSIPPDSQALLLLRHIRDEAHRFAISYHRQLRSNRTLASRLDEVRGVGPQRRRKLIRYFGSVAELSKATEEQIANIPGIPNSLARRIFEQIGRSTDNRREDKHQP